MFGGGDQGTDKGGHEADSERRYRPELYASKGADVPLCIWMWVCVQNPKTSRNFMGCMSSAT